MKIQIDFNILKGLNVLSGKKDIRYYLNGVYVEITQNGAYFVATDGHKLGVYHDDKIKSNELIAHVIPNDLLAQVSKAINKTINLVEIELAPMIEITYLNNTFKAPSVDGKYPDFRRVIPDSLNNEIAQFDPDFLSEFKKCASIISGAKKPDVAIGHNGTGNGGSIVYIDNPQFLGVIMPYRSSANFSEYKKPLWVDYAPIPAAPISTPELEAA